MITYSQCVTSLDTYYTFTASDPDQLFNFTVTPRSNVEGSLNGTTSQPVQGYLVQGNRNTFLICSFCGASED